jgi:hypothetical protein
VLCEHSYDVRLGRRSRCSSEILILLALVIRLLGRVHQYSHGLQQSSSIFLDELQFGQGDDEQKAPDDGVRVRQNFGRCLANSGGASQISHPASTVRDNANGQWNNVAESMRDNDDDE